MVGKVKAINVEEKNTLDEDKVISQFILERSSYKKLAPKLGVAKLHFVSG